MENVSVLARARLDHDLQPHSSLAQLKTKQMVQRPNGLRHQVLQRQRRRHCRRRCVCPTPRHLQPMGAPTSYRAGHPVAPASSLQPPPTQGSHPRRPTAPSHAAWCEASPARSKSRASNYCHSSSTQKCAKHFKFK